MTELDPTARFAPHADAYARGRPGYPPALVDLLRGLGVDGAATVVDVGASTGQSCATLLATGATVIAVEPNPAMRAHAAARFADQPRFTAVAGQAEATTLPDRAVDHAVAMQALHWFELAAARRELARVVRPGGKVVLVWNTRAPITPFMSDLEALIVRFAPDYPRLGHVGAARTARIDEFFAGARYHHHQLAHERALDRTGLTDYLGSISYLPRADDPAHAELVDATAALAARHPAPVRFDYVTDVYVGPAH